MSDSAFDYIIIGAGSSGCVVAAELAGAGNSVVLLEAGGRNRHPFINMPRGYAALWTDPRYFWAFPIREQPGRPKPETWYYGRGLGGSSAVNGTWYFRGQPADYDRWRDLGNREWDWEQMLGAFRELERFDEPGADASRGRNGPLQITTVKLRSSLTRDILAAGVEAGIPNVEDVNTPGRACIGYSQMTVDQKGRRVSAYRAFVARPKSAELEVRCDFVVERIEFDGKRAVGVTGKNKGATVQLRARKEIILCAGVLQSPKLLQLSGIGDPALLASHGITVLRPEPNVGRSMSEHMMLELKFRLRRNSGMNMEFRGLRLYQNVLKYYLTRRGPMAYGLPEISAMLSSSGDENRLDTQLGFLLATFEQPLEGTSEPGRGKTESLPGMSIVAFHLQPRSRGSVAIQSASIDDPVQVDANWLHDPADLEAAVGLVRTIRRVASQPSLAKHIAQEIGPARDARDDDGIRAIVPAMLRSGLHGTGTCRMGRLGEGVVDSRLRVHGVEGLRVVDCSVMPTPISGNTNGPAMALGLRASKMILDDAR